MRLNLPESLERVLASTNLIENLFSRARMCLSRGITVFGVPTISWRFF